MTILNRRFRGLRQALRDALTGRSLWVCLLALSLSGIIWYISQEVKAVYIRDGDQTILCYTLKKDPEHILDQNQIATMAFDVVDFSGFEGKMGVINIKRAFPVTLEVDGAVHTVMTPDVRVEELLTQQNIALRPADLISVNPVLHLSPGDRIVIKRIDTKTIVEKEELPFETIYKDNSLLKPGRIRVLSSGKPGQVTRTYVQRVIDGVPEPRQMIEETTTREPVSQVVLRGSSKSVSELDFGVPLDKNGVPVSYRQLLTNQICTGYSAGPDVVGGGYVYGASRMDLFAGYVAVRADDIPYGTKMYITSADGSFVYGFAIAADTGIALMDDVIDFDLFYESYVESCLNGRKYLNVYLL